MKSAARRFTEDSLRLDLSAVLQSCRALTPSPAARWPASPGSANFVAVPAVVTRRGRPVAQVLVDVMRLERHGQITIVAGPGAGSVAEIRAVAARMVGFRWQFQCALTGKGCRSIYLPVGAVWFGSRTAHRLTYRSLHERPLVRRYRKATRLRHALGEDPPAVTGPLPGRPPAMPGWVYRLRCAALVAAEAGLLEVAA
jgi:hypothetical protein